jgi:hypothetical protein
MRAAAAILQCAARHDHRSLSRTYKTGRAAPTEPGRRKVRAVRTPVSLRTASGGRIDRAGRCAFTFDGKTYQGFAGDTLASALLANGVHLVGARSSITGRAASWPPARKSPTRW